MTSSPSAVTDAVGFCGVNVAEASEILLAMPTTCGVVAQHAVDTVHRRYPTIAATGRHATATAASRSPGPSSSVPTVASRGAQAKLMTAPSKMRGTALNTDTTTRPGRAMPMKPVRDARRARMSARTPISHDHPREIARRRRRASRKRQRRLLAPCSRWTSPPRAVVRRTPMSGCGCRGAPFGPGCAWWIDRRTESIWPVVRACNVCTSFR